MNQRARHQCDHGQQLWKERKKGFSCFLSKLVLLTLSMALVAGTRPLAVDSHSKMDADWYRTVRPSCSSLHAFSNFFRRNGVQLHILRGGGQDGGARSANSKGVKSSLPRSGGEKRQSGNKAAAKRAPTEEWEAKIVEQIDAEVAQYCLENNLTVRDFCCLLCTTLRSL
jgi:hypothetical protein